MRFLLPLLLLSTAAPALADPPDPGARAARFEERRQEREERGERPQPRFERPAPTPMPQVERPQPQVERAPAAAQFDGGQRRFEGHGGADNAGRQGWRDRRAEQPQLPPSGAITGAGRPVGDSVANWRWRDRHGGDRPDVASTAPGVREGGAYSGSREGRVSNRWQGHDDRRDGGSWTGRTDRDGRYAGGNWRDGRTGASSWSREWRRDPRYDWQRYRERNRAIFRVGAYIDPFGYGYRQIGIGYQLYPNYYADQYWIGDPGYYSLPIVSWPYRWVRYYDDALLIDVRDGRVVDAIQSFFW